MANALLSNSKTKHPSGYTWSSYILIPGQHSNFGPITPSQKQSASSNQLFRAVTSQTGTVHGIQEYFRNKEAFHTEHLSLFKDDFFFLTESSITEQSCAVFSLRQDSTELCITTYDNIFQTFKMQPLSPHQSSCHPSIPPPPQASAPLFLLGRGTETGCNYCLQVFTYSHILMEPNCWSFHNPKTGLNPQLRKKKEY